MKKPFLFLLTSLYISFSLPNLAAVSRLSNPSQDRLARIDLPGGLAPIFRYAPFLKDRAHHQLLDLFFAYLLETEPLQKGGRSRRAVNPRREAALNFYRQYLDFRLWLIKKGLFTERLDLRFKGESLEKSQKILAYFGMTASYRNTGTLSVLETDDRRKFLERRAIFRWLGVNPHLVRSDAVLSFDFKSDSVPVILTSRFWQESVLDMGTRPPEEIIVRWLEDPEAMRLYRSLSKLPAPAQISLVKNLSMEKLIGQAAPALLAVGSNLRFDEAGELLLPGGERAEGAWIDLVGAPLNNKKKFLSNLFSKDQGRVFYLLASLSCPEQTAQTNLFSSPQDVWQLYRTVPAPGISFLTGRPTRKYFDLGDYLTNALLIRSDENQGPALFSGKQETSAGFEPDLVNWTQPGSLKYQYLSGVFSGLGMDTRLAQRFFGRIHSIESGTGSEDRRTVVTLFQAPLALLRSFSRNGILNREEVEDLAADFLMREWRCDDSGAIAVDVAAFLAEAMVPLLRTRLQMAELSPSAVLIRSLATEYSDPRSLKYRNQFKFDPLPNEIKRIEGFLQTQKVCSIDDVLSSLCELRQTETDPVTISQSIKRTCLQLASNQISTDYLSPEYREAVVHTNPRNLVRAAENLESAAREPNQGGLPSSSSALAVELAPYLAETLMSLVYAEYVCVDDLVIRTDENFIRKHHYPSPHEADRLFSAYLGQQLSASVWGPPVLVEDKLLGCRIAGSLFGLCYPLTRLRVERLTVPPGTRFADSAYPVAVMVAAKLTRPSLVTEEALELVGGLISLAREKVRSCASGSGPRAHLLSVTDRLLGARRAWAFRQLTNSGEADGAIELLLPSELFLLGKESLNWPLGQPSLFQNILRDLKGRVSSDSVAQFGFPVTTLAGSDTLMLCHLGPVESLTTFGSVRRLAERISCEFKLRVAEEFSRAGLPAALYKPVCREIAFRVITGIEQAHSYDWQAAVSAARMVKGSEIKDAITRVCTETEGRLAFNGK